MREKLLRFIQSHFGHVFLAFVIYFVFISLFLLSLKVFSSAENLNDFSDKVSISMSMNSDESANISKLHAPQLREIKLAVVMRGMGLSDTQTETAIKELPSGVSFAFSPYASKLKHWFSETRKFDHSLILEIPMEPKNYPEDDPGPLGLLTRYSDLRNVELLKGILRKAHGFEGVMTWMGDGFMKSGEHLEPIFKHLKNKQLFLLDTVEHKKQEEAKLSAKKIAKDIMLPYKDISFVLDDTATENAVMSKLKMLEETARLGSGYGIAIADPYPATIEALKIWSADLEKRNVHLVPVSLILGKGK